MHLSFNVVGLNVKRVHRLQSMVNDVNLSKILCPTSLSICEAFIEGQQFRAACPNDR